MTDQPKYKEFKILEQPLQGRHLVEASAGTGKTYNITALYLRLILERDLQVRNILVVTFTKAATEELKARILQRLHLMSKALQGGDPGDDQFVADFVEQPSVSKDVALNRVHRAIRQFDEAAVYTIHGFCQRALQEFAFETGTGAEFELLEDGEELLQEVADDLWRQTVDAISKDQHTLLYDLLVTKIKSPDDLLKKFKSLVGKPYLKLEPHSDQLDWPPEQLKSLYDCWHLMQEVWNDSKDEIIELIHSPLLDRHSYRKDFNKKRIQALEDFLNAEDLSLSPDDKIKYFTNKRLQEKEDPGPAPEHEFFDLCDGYYGTLDDLKNWLSRWIVNLFLRFRKEVRRRKERREVMDYDDMLNRLLDALRDEDTGDPLAAALREKYQAALIDEFQDTDPVQYEIFDRIYPQGRDDLLLYLIGDPKQSIYGFRGADVYAYLEARNKLPAEHCYTLPANYRSDDRFIESLNRLFGSQDHPFWNEQMDYHKVRAGRKHKALMIPGEKEQAPLRWIRQAIDDKIKVDDARQLAAEWSASEIKWLLHDSGAQIGEMPLEGKDIAVLVRKHYEADMVHQALKDRGIDSVRYTKQSVFATEEARYIQELLQAVAEPANESLIRAALSNPLMGLGAQELHELRENDTEWLSWLELFREWNEAWSRHGVANMLRSALKEVNGMQRLSEGVHGERKLTNIMHLLELLQSREQEGIGRRRLIKWLIEKRMEPKQNEGEELRLESDENLVKIVTIHRSKGLEYPIVFCPFLWDGPDFKKTDYPLTYHEQNGSTEAVLDFRNKDEADEDGSFMKSWEEELSEELRLAYVALTRAGYRCYLTWMDYKTVSLSPMGCWLRNRNSIHAELLDKKKNRPKPGDLYNELKTKVAATDLFAIQTPRNGVDSSKRKIGESINGNARSWEGNDELEPGWSMTSFTQLAGAGGNGEDQRDYDGWFEKAWEAPGPETKQLDYNSIFDFPRGAAAGTCLHNILEQVDFRKVGVDAPGEIKRQLEQHGFDEQWSPLLERKMRQWVDVELAGSGHSFKLNAIEKTDTLREMEFTYPVDPAVNHELLQIIREEGEGPLPSQASLETGGFMKGFIDLVVRHGGRYYIIDYKSNHLGDSLEDYRPEALRREVLEDSYDLQYHIYTVALMRYLQSRHEPFDYEQQFGGIFYLFLRGLQHGHDTGIHYALPSKETVEKLNNYLKAYST